MEDSKTTTTKNLVQAAFLSTGSALLPGEVREQASPGSYSLESPVEYHLHTEVDREPALDITRLPPVIEFADGYRPGIVVFATSIRPGVMVTNLPVHKLSVHHIALCSNVAEIALLALSVSAGFSLEYLGEYSKKHLADVGQEFADQFLRVMAEDGKTVIHEIADVRQWLSQQVWWRRSTDSAPGTEFA